MRLLPWTVGVAASLACWGASAQPATPVAVEIPWTETAVPLRADHYNARSFTCPATEDPTLFEVWGTNLYTDNSSICAAAVHAGMITTAGGVVTIQEVDGLEAYDGTTRNGVVSLDYGVWFFTFQFI